MLTIFSQSPQILLKMDHWYHKLLDTDNGRISNLCVDGNHFDADYCFDNLVRTDNVSCSISHLIVADEYLVSGNCVNNFLDFANSLILNLCSSDTAINTTAVYHDKLSESGNFYNPILTV